MAGVVSSRSRFSEQGLAQSSSGGTTSFGLPSGNGAMAMPTRSWSSTRLRSIVLATPPAGVMPVPCARSAFSMAGVSAWLFENTTFPITVVSRSG